MNKQELLSKIGEITYKCEQDIERYSLGNNKMFIERQGRLNGINSLKVWIDKLYDRENCKMIKKDVIIQGSPSYKILACDKCNFETIDITIEKCLYCPCCGRFIE